MEIKEIRYVKNKEAVKIKSSDPFFEFFYPDITRIKKEVE